jgi:hypothetical protein
MRLTPLNLLVFFGLVLFARAGFAGDRSREAPQRRVLVELYTSQGCNMCPEAERLLGVLADRNAQIVPVAFHVDYFDNPWKDPFSDPLYSKRQAAYNEIHTAAKHPGYGLFYTPMLMIDGEASVNGRDLAGAEEALARAAEKKPRVALQAQRVTAKDGRSGEATVTVAPRFRTVEDAELLVCAVLRDDRVVTHVDSGENARKTLTARYPVLATRFQYIRLRGVAEATVKFSFQLNHAWNADRLDLVIFAQDRKTGLVHQAMVLPWIQGDTRTGSGVVAKGERQG